MNQWSKILMIVFAIAVTAMKYAHAQSSMPVNFLPMGFTPGTSLFHDGTKTSDLNFETGITTPTHSSSAKYQNSLLSGKNFEIEYSFIMFGLEQESQYESYQIASFRIYSTWKYRISNDVILFVEPYLIFRTGADQATDGSSHQGTVFFPKDASLIWMPASWLQLRGGILDQNFVHSFLMLEDQAFPGARSTLYFGNGDLRASLIAEDDILTYSSNTSSTNQLEATPTFASAALETHYNLNRHDQVKLSAGYWQYDNLPSSLAALAMLGGNTVDRTSDTFSVFTYQYKGVEARSRLELAFGPVDFNLYSEGLYNTAAPQGLNTAWNGGGEIVFRGSQNRKYGFNAEYFHVEPDSAVSAYNSVEFDRTNRNGIMLMPYFKWGKKENKISIRFVTSTPIYNNAPQSDVTQFRIRWETAYDVL